MKSLDQEYCNIVERIESLRDGLFPFGKRFHEFIKTHETFGYLNMDVNFREWTDLEKSQLVIPQRLQDTVEGVRYQLNVPDYDIEHEYYFHIPHEYFSDPDAWEQSLLQRIKTDDAQARNAFLTIFPETAENSTNPRVVKTHNSYGVMRKSKDFLEYSVSNTEEETERFRGFRSYFEYDGVLYSPSHMFYKISTGEIFLSYSSKPDDEYVKSTVLTHSLTTKEANQLPRTQWDDCGLVEFTMPDAFSVESYDALIKEAGKR